MTAASAAEVKLDKLAHAVTDADAALYAHIRKMRADGYSLRALAALSGVSHQTIANICREV